ncbi:hypothetical protein HAX54_006871 [Datura stramonium]|uniref:S-acyltransferase n=1 Tax=Datura stramonium TaxID=4076 RepID=A0ABS8TAT7_DATST|nr:hypothetical protein [Datura stramonium]
MASLQQPIEENETSTEVSPTELQNSSIEEIEINFLAKIKKILFTLWRDVIGVRTLHKENLTQNHRGDRTNGVRLYHVWPGKNVFYLKGLLICGRDPRRLLLTIVSISLSSLVLAVYVANDVSKNSSITMISLCVLLTLTVFANLIMVSVIDPGIIPSPESTQSGRRNYRFYVLLLVVANVYFVCIFSFSCLKIQQKNAGNDNNALMGLIGDCPETLALACFSLVAACFVDGLTCYHVYLIAVNQTAYENFRQQYGSTKNPFDKGVVNNIKEMGAHGESSHHAKNLGAFKWQIGS